MRNDRQNKLKCRIRFSHSSFSLLLRRSRLILHSAFSLIEVAASVAIMGGVIVGLLLARSRSLESHRSAREIMTCTRICASRVAALRAGLAGTGEGPCSYPEGYRWTITPAELPEDATSGLRGYEVHVTAPSAGRGVGESVSATVWLVPPGNDE